MKLNKLPLNVIGLNRVGLNQIGSPSHRADTSDRPYIDPEVLASLVAVCICDGKSNDDPDRAVIKNLVDPDNPFVISNAAYKLNSGYGLYATDFTTWIGNASINIEDKTKDSFHITNNTDERKVGLGYNLVPGDNDFEGYKIKVEIIKGSGGEYKYYDKEGHIQLFALNESKIYTLPTSYNSVLTTTEFNAFFINPNSAYKITQIPSHQGAFVTDGIDDLITSTKTVKEMLGGSNEVTVVSMVHSMQDKSFAYTNYLRPGGYIRNQVIPASNGKTGIYGYSISNISVPNFNNFKIINRILGDRTDYTAELGGQFPDWNIPFSVEGYLDRNSLNPAEVSSIAWYWTFIANKVLTTDQINQVISYFNLDKHVKPDIIYDTIRQGITNENHASFNDELTDFSGNGHNMKIYNSAWKLGSGIGKYEEDFTSWLIGTNINVTNDTIKAVGIVSSYVSTKVTPNSEIAPFTIKVIGIPKNGEIRYYYCSSSTKIDSFYIREDGQYNVPQSERWELTGSYRVGFIISNPSLDWSRLVIEQIPDYEGALVSDGIDDYGKVENLPIYKDYTVVADREIVDGLIDNANGGVATRSYNYAKGAFGFDWKNQAFSFGGNTDRIIDVQRFISYQSKYVNNGIQLITGNVVDNNPLYMARLGEENRYSKLALWSFLLFSYTLSEFLLERQLKRYKLGTLYPDMVEFRPVISRNIPYNAIEISQGPTTLYNKSINKTGIYLQEGSTVRVYIQPSGIDEVSKITVNGVEYTDLPINPNGYYYADFPITKSPQKISYAIDEYIRYEDIVQPYPAIINLKQDGKTITWGDKLKVGSDIVFVGSANLLPELYTVSETRYNGVTLYPNTIIKVEKSMVFDNARTYLKANEPSCILSPNRLRIPNSSYKILGYIPDLTGKGNHGRLNNFAYTEESGANEDGSIRFDGADDHITIPTLAHGSKCMLMKVNWNKDALMLYDQKRDNNPNSFAIYIPNFNNEDSIAYSSRNDGKTYIDGVLNTSVKGSQLKDVTHNITITNSNSNNDNTVSPAIGSNAKYNAFYAQMALFDFMLFPEISSEEEIQELNDIVGIEGNVWGTLTQLINSTLISNEILIKNE